MRITGGIFGGRRLQVAAGATLRPTQDRVREAVFSALGAGLEGASFLDVFAGTGAVGIEAWSRGAARIGWVESDRKVFRGLQANLSVLGPPAPGIVLEPRQMDVAAYCRRFSGRPYDFLYVDPPYDQATGPALESVLKLALQHDLLQAGGILVLEQRRGGSGMVGTGLTEIWCRCYGGTQVRMYRRHS